MKNLSRRRLVEKEYPYNILYTIEEMHRSKYRMPQHVTSDICDGIEYAISCLTQRERNVIHSRYAERKSFEEIGLVCGISGNRISQIDRKTICKLGSPPLVGYLIYGKEEFDDRLRMCKSENMEMLPEEVLNKSITELWVSMNIKRYLFRMGCKTIKDVIQNYQLSDISDISKNNYGEVLECIRVLTALYLQR